MVATLTKCSTGFPALGGDPLRALRADMPYRVSPSVEILGINFDTKVCSERQIKSILSRARIRMGVFSSLSGSCWGADPGILRLAGGSPVAGLLRYGLAVAGSRVYEQPLIILQVCHTNVLSREIAGVSGSARLPILHATAGVPSAHITAPARLIAHLEPRANPGVDWSDRFRLRTG